MSAPAFPLNQLRFLASHKIIIIRPPILAPGGTRIRTFCVLSDQQNQTLAALLRQWLPGHSWSNVRQIVAGRRVRINGEVWRDDARRLKEGDRVEVLDRPLKITDHTDQIVLRHIDEHIIVVEKPAGISTVRHPTERAWSYERRRRVPTLDDLVLRQTGARFPKRGQGKPPRLRIVQRLDKETSGLVVFARTVEAERGLGKQFARHSVHRQYLAIVPGRVEARTIRTSLVRDRGDRRRGSSPVPGQGKEAITHMGVVESLPRHTLLSCRLETGRTHQIRIHLAEIGHPVCGDKVYGKAAGETDKRPGIKAPRLALHAAELGFIHPVTGEAMRWEMPLPPDLREFVDGLRTPQVAL
ncbi:MAG: RluA family pseudouridine synthase [Planctomycetes bacterium]|nr:RluA family pseudouridine synthase [Planctomycetota bacterium]